MTDTGPPYPHPDPVSGSNAIGKFQIGISPIGTISSWDPWITVISQYANSPVIDEMVTSFNAAVDQTENIENFYDLIFNVQTAVGYGLDAIGRIVGVSRTLPLPGGATYLGNEEANSWTGFGQGGFYSGNGVSNNFVLGDDNFRTLIYAKMAGNISDGSILSLNQILLTLFAGRGICYVADGLDMSMTYTFLFLLNPVEKAIVEASGVLPSPVGIIVNVSSLT
jgi:hypothetical protein